MVDLPTQRAARWIVPHLHEDTDDHDGRQRFDAAIDRMQPLLDELQQAPRHCVADHPSIPAAPGIYLFSSHEVPIYVGQSRNLRKRLTQHTDSKSGRDQASFAFNLAKRSAREAGVPLTGSRSVVESLPEFAAHFDHARKEVAEMEVQFIELHDPIERSLFEIYAALTFETDEFNITSAQAMPSLEGREPPSTRADTPR
jgi:GIY-YIG catalytic domain